MTREDYEAEWEEANSDRCCSCHIHPPCSFCVDGFSLPKDEYVEIMMEQQGGEPVSTPEEDYDRAMRGL